MKIYSSTLVRSMAIPLSEARRELSHFAPTLHDHLLKICVAPNHVSAMHWCGEIATHVGFLKRIKIKGRNVGFRPEEVRYYLDLDNAQDLLESLLGSPVEEFIPKDYLREDPGLKSFADKFFVTYTALVAFIRKYLCYAESPSTRYELTKQFHTISLGAPK